MRRSLYIGLAGIAVGINSAICLAAQTTSIKQLSPKSRPILSVVGLNGNDIVTVSQYKTKAVPDPTTVYRYVFRGDYKKILQAFQTRLTKKDGWKLEYFSPNEPSISRELPKGQVAMQALLFHAARLIPDEHGGHPAKGKESEGWVWISYNERVRTKSLK